MTRSGQLQLAASWLVAGAPADAVVYGRDPREDLAQLAAPVAVVLRGRCVRRRVTKRWPDSSSAV